MAADLTATAQANSQARREAAATVLAPDGSGRLDRFHSLVAGSSFTTNVAADKVLAFAAEDDILDTRRVHIHQAGGDEGAGLQAFAAAQGAWLRRRQGFEDLWEHGRQLVYGAVNAGGMGTEGRFGPLCLVVGDPEHGQPDALAVFPGDSAQRYTNQAAVVDGAWAVVDATFVGRSCPPGGHRARGGGNGQPRGRLAGGRVPP